MTGGSGAAAEAFVMSALLKQDGIAPRAFSRLRGAKGLRAVVGEVTEIRDGKAVWVLHPAYAAWFWPLMLKATDLALFIPESLLEPAEDADCRLAPRKPTEPEKDELLKTPERSDDAVQVYSLILKGKQPSVRKGFPTRTVALSALRYCGLHIVGDRKKSIAGIVD